MRKIWFWGIGVALFSAAGLMYVAGHHSDQSGMRSVGEEEASMILGGGNGSDITFQSCDIGNAGNCSAFNGWYNSSNNAGEYAGVGAPLSCGSRAGCASYYSAREQIGE
ncbi:MAG: hypothetical protein LBJ67_09040 [Planctomycetaceae bacterium]|jgi:hypothetical protein|nr:hypothetical protein [Planctomycetaceae bacterium]